MPNFIATTIRGRPVYIGMLDEHLFRHDWLTIEAPTIKPLRIDTKLIVRKLLCVVPPPGQHQQTVNSVDAGSDARPCAARASSGATVDQ